MFSRYSKYCVLLIGIFLLSACQQQSKQDLVVFVDNAYKDERPEIEPLPPIVPYEEYIYSADELADPFSRTNVFIGSGATNEEDDLAAGIDPNRRREPLEAFPLDGLRLDGVLEFQGQLSAIVRSPDGDSVPVNVGNYVGLNNGQILSINSVEQVVEIEETVRDATGKWVKRIVKLTGEDPGKSTNK